MYRLCAKIVKNLSSYLLRKVKLVMYLHKKSMRGLLFQIYLEWVQRMENLVIPDSVSHTGITGRVSEHELRAHLTLCLPLSVLVLETSDIRL